jgi:hypothetical protein
MFYVIFNWEGNNYRFSQAALGRAIIFNGKHPALTRNQGYGIIQSCHWLKTQTRSDEVANNNKV